MAKTASNDVANGLVGWDSRPSLSIDTDNRIMVSNSPFLNRIDNFAPQNYFIWPSGFHVALDGNDDFEMFDTDTTMRVEPDTLYEISIEWQVNVDGSAATKDQIILTINDSVTRMDFSIGDYSCHNYMDMLISIGQTVENNKAEHLKAGETYENVEGEVFDVYVTGLCPFPEEQGRDMCCH